MAETTTDDIVKQTYSIKSYNAMFWYSRLPQQSSTATGSLTDLLGDRSRASTTPRDDYFHWESTIYVYNKTDLTIMNKETKRRKTLRQPRSRNLPKLEAPSTARTSKCYEQEPTKMETSNLLTLINYKTCERHFYTDDVIRF